MEFCTRRELVNQTGHDVYEWALVVQKELLDNALDAAEEAEIAPAVTIAVNGRSIVIQDNGPGIPAKTIEGILDYSVRVSSREAYVEPDARRSGQCAQDHPADGLRARRAPRRQCRRRDHHRSRRRRPSHPLLGRPHQAGTADRACRRAPSTVVYGTRITVELPLLWDGRYDEYDLLDGNRDRFLELAESYAWLNPHLTLNVSWNGEQVIDIKASNPAWRKWLPTWPTSAHWYDKSSLRRYMAAHIANRDSITVREFISEFRGMTGTARQKLVLAETGASHVSLHSYFGLRTVNTANIVSLLASLQKHTRPIRPVDLGIIGKDHLYRRMEAAGGDPKTFTYNRTIGETNGVPRVIEFAFGIHRDGLAAAGRVPTRKIVTGVNWSPGINNPFRQLGRGGAGLDGILAEVRANTSQPVIAALHLACPRVTYTDRGKSAIVVDGSVEDDNGEED